MGKLLRFLVLACVVQAWGAQGLFKGFTPDENGTNLDDPQTRKIAPSVAAGTVVNDCTDCPEMVVLPAGSFVMGSDKYANAQPTHTVILSSFLIGRTEVTQVQWAAVMGNNPSQSTGRTLPVEKVSWDEIQRFITKLNQKTGRKYRLPSEAEWEYAARAGSITEWSFGNDESMLGNYAWHSQNSGSKTQAVGQKLPNTFGLFDMHGNVWEWTQDCWHENYVGAPSDASAWTTDCYRDTRVLRGGSWGNSSGDLRSADRIWYIRGGQFSSFGFRLARDL